jgi:subtilisin family serine protease
VGGIVGASWNGKGMDGVCENAQLMVIRCVPNGDERDKDVANAIRYAVDNGARVVNMSFGKSFSPGKEAVDAAAEYAESKGVLLIHAAGNDSKNIDEQANFPKDTYNDGGECSTWMEIGASGSTVEGLMADFSNYGKKSVDVFAPGVDIYSTVPGGGFKDNSGTSMAAPVASGVAATILSYYPQLTATDVKAIMMQSATDYRKVKIERTVERKAIGKFFARIFISKKKNEKSEIPPRTYKTKSVRFGDMSVTGGVINLYEALKLAETWKK